MDKKTYDLHEKNKVDQLELRDSPNKKEYMEILQLLKSSLLEEQQVDDFGISLQKEHFKDYISKTEKYLSKATSQLATINTINSNLPKDIELYVILLCGEYLNDEEWSSPQIRCLVEQLRQIIVERSSSNCFLSLLLLYKIDDFLTELKPKLLPIKWKSYPAAVHCFMWILLQFQVPCLGDSIGSILPMCLILVDDHLNENKIKGLLCLNHLASYLSRTDLIQYGRGDVIYNAVEHMIYFRDAVIIQSIGKFLMKFLNKIEHNLTTQNLSWNRFDDVLSIWLPSMEMEQKCELREAYIENLNSLLFEMGMASLRWSTKLLAILSEYSEVENTLQYSLLCLRTFIRRTWPKISSNAHSICSILMKVAIRLYKVNPTTTELPHTETEILLQDCFSDLKKSSDEECNRLIKELIENSEINKFSKKLLVETE